MGIVSTEVGKGPGFTHQAVLYRGANGYVDRIRPILERAHDANQPILVAVPTDKARLLSQNLNGSFTGAKYVPMEETGRNPGRIISLWYDFLEECDGSDVIWGVGEPLWSGRTKEEVVECQLHERLLNHAFGSVRTDFRLFCPYDTDSLESSVVDEAKASHPAVTDGSGTRDNATFDGSINAPLLPGAGVDSETFISTADRSLADMREHLAEQATQFGLARRRLSDFQLAVNEILTNSIQYAGEGWMAVWKSEGAVVCEVHDSGQIADPLVGRRRPSPTAERGRGVWLAYQLCDLVQLRTGRAGTQVRLHASISG